LHNRKKKDQNKKFKIIVFQSQDESLTTFLSKYPCKALWLYGTRIHLFEGYYIIWSGNAAQGTNAVTSLRSTRALREELEEDKHFISYIQQKNRSNERQNNRKETLEHSVPYKFEKIVSFL